MQIASSGYERTVMSPETVESYNEHIQSEQNVDKIRELTKASVKQNEFLANTLGKGMGLFQKSVFVFLFVALVNIVVMVLPEKTVKQSDD